MNRLTQDPTPTARNDKSPTQTVEDDGTLSDVQDKEPVRKDPIPLNSNSSFFQPEQTIVMRQSPMWARGIAIAIMGVTVSAIAWASIATIEQVIPAVGKLQPMDTVKDVNAPVNGVVKSVLVKDNDLVKKDQILVIMDSSTTKAELQAAEKIRTNTLQENSFYRTLLQNGLTGAALQAAVTQLNLPWEVVAFSQ